MFCNLDMGLSRFGGGGVRMVRENDTRMQRSQRNCWSGMWRRVGRNLPSFGNACYFTRGGDKISVFGKRSVDLNQKTWRHIPGYRDLCSHRFEWDSQISHESARKLQDIPGMYRFAHKVLRRFLYFSQINKKCLQFVCVFNFWMFGLPMWCLKTLRFLTHAQRVVLNF